MTVDNCEIRHLALFVASAKHCDSRCSSQASESLLATEKHRHFVALVTSIALTSGERETLPF